jgi:catechol 2,3-dioxygenase-like lactoylglutathione lyase family enzyme
MKTPKNIDVLFVAGFGPIVRDPAASRKFYSETLGLSFKEETSRTCQRQDYQGLFKGGGLQGAHTSCQ